MSADLLREAAALMRERAEAATPGPWSAANEHELLGPDASRAWCVSNMRPGYEDNATHIASWHPAVALAVADWLDKEATWADIGAANSPDDEALTLARAYLGRDA